VALACGAVALFASSASATLFIYEPFDYADTGPINDGAYLGDGNQSGALGTSGTWSQVSGGNTSPPTNEIDVRSAGLSFTDGGGNVLPVTGGHVTRDNRVGQNSSWISSSFAATEGTTTWMTFLYADGGFSGPDSFLGLTSQTVAASDAQALTAAGFGVGVGVNSVGGPERALGASVYDNATGQTFTPEPGPAPYTFNGPGTSPVHLLGMKVNWNAGSDDEIFVFDITDITTEPLESAAVASATFNWTQSQQDSLNLLSYADTQVEDVDEIRVASTFLEAVGAAPIPEPSVTLLGALGGLALLRRRRK